MSGEADEFPRTVVRRLVRQKLVATAEKEVFVNKDAIIAFSESAKVFIHYLAATANDICNEHKRSTVSATDILTALKEIDFPEFIAPLEATLAVFQEEANLKRIESKAKAAPAKPNAGQAGSAKIKGAERDDEQNDDENEERPSQKMAKNDGPESVTPPTVGQEEDVDVLDEEKTDGLDSE